MSQVFVGQDVPPRESGARPALQTSEARMLDGLRRASLVLAGLLIAATADARTQSAGAVEARAVWDRAIAAKGGRERLRSIRNFVVMSETKGSSFWIRDVAPREYIERLFVLPDRLWELDDYRPGLMGVSGKFLSRDGAWGSSGTPMPRLRDELAARVVEGQAVFLMESAFVQPGIVGLRRGRTGLRTLDIVDTRVGDSSVEYHLSRDTHLPLKIVWHRPIATPATASAAAHQSTHTREYRLRSYTSVDGLQMPSEVGDRNRTTYRFNVEYDEAAFAPGSSFRLEVNGWARP